MNKKLLVAILATTTALSLSAGIFSSCFSKPLTDAPLEGEILADFSEGKTNTVFESDGWSNGSVFNTWWKKDRVAYEDGAMKLSIVDNPDGSAETNDEYFGGEGRTYQYFGYGDYEVKMKPSKASGTASTFFTCTGDYDTDAEGNPNPHDEIDIEFLGKDTTHVQFNYFVDGVGGHEYMYKLGFDASKEYHEYGYRWTKDYIVWFVDDKPVYKVEASAKNPIPSTPGRILMNYWTGNSEAEGWMGKYNGTPEYTSDYLWIKTSATPIGELPSENNGDDTPLENVAEFDLSSATWDGNKEVYTLTPDTANKSLTVDYTDLAGGSYSNINANIASVAGTRNIFTVTAKNNGTQSAKLRVDINSAQKVNNTKACNVSATMDGNTATTDTNWGGSSFEIAAGATAQIKVVYDPSRVPTDVMFFLDSYIDKDTGSYTGSITLSNASFAGVVEGGTSNPSEGSGVQLSFNDGNGTYTVDKRDQLASEITVTYTNIAGNTYANMMADAAALAANNNTFTFTIKNNGDATVRVRIDLHGPTWINTNAANPDQGRDSCNLSSTGGGSWTDLDWGGTHLDLAAGEEATVTITYSNSEATGAVESILLFLDSCKGDEGPYSGNVTIGNFIFSNN